jgi:WD40 repeat protein
MPSQSLTLLLRLVKVWDYQNKTCVQTLEGHTQNVSIVLFHPELPIIVSGSEDGNFAFNDRYAEEFPLIL